MQGSSNEKIPKVQVGSAAESTESTTTQPSQTGKWTKKRKLWVGAGPLMSLALVAIVVVIPIKTSIKKASREEVSINYDLDFPTSFNGTGLNGVLGGRKSNGTYNQLLVCVA